MCGEGGGWGWGRGLGGYVGGWVGGLLVERWVGYWRSGRWVWVCREGRRGGVGKALAKARLASLQPNGLNVAGPVESVSDQRKLSIRCCEACTWWK